MTTKTPLGNALPRARRIASLAVGSTVALGLFGALVTTAPAAQVIVHPTGATAAGDVYAKRSLSGATRATLAGYPRSTVSLAQLRRSGNAAVAVVSGAGRPVVARHPRIRRPSAAARRDRGIVLTTSRFVRSSRSRPDTWITRGPLAGGTTASTRARFGFGTDVGTSLQCSLDERRFSRCRSPLSYSGLAAGRHSFRVRAVGRGGVDRTAPRRAWRVAAGAAAPGSSPSAGGPAAAGPSAGASIAPLVALLGLPVVAQVRPYDDASPWNTPIAGDVPVLPNSAAYVNAIADNNRPLTSDPDHYAVPVYYYDDNTPRRTVQFSGSYGTYDEGDGSRVRHGAAPTVSGIPIPDGAVQSNGSQIVFWNPQTGDEYSFWQFQRSPDGTYSATNGNRYRTTAGYYGRFADGKACRGAGTPYLAGLVRAWEIAHGRIGHALAFAYDSPSSEIAYPAAKSDGTGVIGSDAPEGTRFQLDPALTDADFTAWGLAPEAKIIARALQQYGMYAIDNSVATKVYMEDRLTARWHAGITKNLISKIPLSRFRAVAAPQAPA